MTLNISAIDPSMQDTGLANLKLGGLIGESVTWRTARVKSVANGDAYAVLNERFDRMVDRVMWQMNEWGQPDLIVMEGPSMQSKGRQHTMAGYWWKAYAALAAFAPVLIVPPTNRIIYATGNGNSSKDEVMLAASRRYPDAPITNNDDADATVLAAIGARVMGRPIDSLPKTHLRALDKVDVSAALPVIKRLSAVISPNVKPISVQ
jgi:crossover junction endodeoxyribonuclease RuvC